MNRLLKSFLLKLSILTIILNFGLQKSNAEYLIVEKESNGKYIPITKEKHSKIYPIILKYSFPTCLNPEYTLSHDEINKLFHPKASEHLCIQDLINKSLPEISLIYISPSLYQLFLTCIHLNLNEEDSKLIEQVANYANNGPVTIKLHHQINKIILEISNKLIYQNPLSGNLEINIPATINYIFDVFKNELATLLNYGKEEDYLIKKDFLKVYNKVESASKKYTKNSVGYATYFYNINQVKNFIINISLKEKGAFENNRIIIYRSCSSTSDKTLPHNISPNHPANEASYIFTNNKEYQEGLSFAGPGIFASTTTDLAACTFGYLMRSEFRKLKSDFYIMNLEKDKFFDLHSKNPSKQASIEYQSIFMPYSSLLVSFFSEGNDFHPRIIPWLPRNRKLHYQPECYSTLNSLYIFFNDYKDDIAITKMLTKINDIKDYLKQSPQINPYKIHEKNKPYPRANDKKERIQQRLIHKSKTMTEDLLHTNQQTVSNKVLWDLPVKFEYNWEKKLTYSKKHLMYP